MGIGHNVCQLVSDPFYLKETYESGLVEVFRGATGLDPSVTVRELPAWSVQERVPYVPPVRLFRYILSYIPWTTVVSLETLGEANAQLFLVYSLTDLEQHLARFDDVFALPTDSERTLRLILRLTNPEATWAHSPRIRSPASPSQGRRWPLAQSPPPLLNPLRCSLRQ